MANSLFFVRMETDFKGLTTRAVAEFDRYLNDDSDQFRWVFVEDPELIARTLEVLSEDLPEENLARVVPAMPYLFLLFRRSEVEPNIPVEATLAFLSVVNQSGMITIMRQASDRTHLAPFFNLNPGQWEPLVFMAGGVPDLDRPWSETSPPHCSYF